MKKVLLLLPILLMFSFSIKDDTLTKEEREYVTKYLAETRDGLFKAVNGLSEEQLKFKPAADKWSVEDCVKHIAISEQNIWGMVSALLKKSANPEKRSEIKATDEQVIKMVTDRSQKAQAPEQFRPENLPYKSTGEALQSFRENREKLIQYMTTTNDDFRNHVSPFAMGSFDAYQMVLLLAAHSKRHTLQIEEVKADANFPR